MHIPVFRVYSTILIVVNIILIVESANSQNSDAGLRSISVLFRHGDRTPSVPEMEMYPNYNISFAEGFGQLTNDGKRRSYQLGQKLRNWYNEFLGDLYKPNSVYARSTDFDRTKMTLQLLLAGLYPPKRSQVWNDHINWQPIPTHAEAYNKESLLSAINCAGYLEERARVNKLPKVLEKVAAFKDLMQNLTEWTGKIIQTPMDVYKIYHSLVGISSMNLTLPDWSAGLFPNGMLLNATILEYQLQSYTQNMQKLSGGKILRYMIDHMNATTKESDIKNEKIYLYGAHEYTIAGFLHTLGLFKPHIPEYTSAIIVELHEIEARRYVKVLYYLGIPPRFVILRIPGCDQLCPLEKFIQLLQNVIPSDPTICTKKYKEVV